MTNRERWIVYPLLFYALVMGFKATYQDPVEFRCQTIECQQLKVGLINGSPAIAATAGLGKMILLDPSAAMRNEATPNPVAEAAASVATDTDTDTDSNSDVESESTSADVEP